MSEQKRIDTEAGTSDRPGVLGWVEGFLRRHRVLAQILTMSPLLFVYITSVGLAMSPFFLFLKYFIQVFNQGAFWYHYLALPLALGSSFICFIVILVLVVPLFNWPIRGFVRPHRGSAFSLENIAWMYHNALTFLVRYTVLEFITPSPLAQFFYKAMGMKIGKGVIINTTNISDPCLITIEDSVFIGGSAHILGHYGVKGYLVLAPVVIKKGASIGLKATIMADVIIGEKAVVKPHTAVLPKTQVPDQSTYPEN